MGLRSVRRRTEGKTRQKLLERMTHHKRTQNLQGIKHYWLVGRVSLYSLDYIFDGRCFFPGTLDIRQRDNLFSVF